MQYVNIFILQDFFYNNELGTCCRFSRYTSRSAGTEVWFTWRTLPGISGPGGTLAKTVNISKNKID